MRFSFAVLVWFWTALGAAVAQPPPEPIRLTVRPAAEPVPALQYRLIPDLLDQAPGNAAFLYYRAFSPEWFSQSLNRRQPDFFQKVEKWTKTPLAELPRGELSWLLTSPALHEVDLAARRQFCDWELTERFLQEGVYMVFPDLQGFRQQAQLLALRARLEMAAKQYDKAIYTLQTGISMARHLGEGPTLIHALVGIAIFGVMADQLEELLRCPEAPNLYWALTTLPQPLIGLPKAMQGEQFWLYGTFPELRGIEAGPKTAGELKALQEKLGWMVYLGDIPSPEKSKGTSAAGQLGLLALVMKTYPQAKRSLLARGRKLQEVEAMPAFQVVLIYSLHQFHRLRDASVKWCYLPYWQARAGIKQADQLLKQAKVNFEEGIPFASLLLPATQKVVFAQARTERRIAALRCLEALRLFASAHDGRLPETLNDIREVPIPHDPVTGKAFEYHRDGDKAMLTGPSPPGEEKDTYKVLKYEVAIKP